MEKFNIFLMIGTMSVGCMTLSFAEQGVVCSPEYVGYGFSLVTVTDKKVQCFYAKVTKDHTLDNYSWSGTYGVLQGDNQFWKQTVKHDGTIAYYCDGKKKDTDQPNTENCPLYKEP
jgi:hypothetical protein